MRRLRILPSAEAELDAAISWHREHRGADVAKRILSEVLRAIDQIVDLPFAWPRVRTDPTTRVRHLSRSRYSVFYEVEPDWITIHQITHMRRHPDAWKRDR